MQKPGTIEYAPYYQHYIDLINTDDVISIFKLQSEEIVALLKNINEEQASTRYAEGKWTLKEVVAHIVDSERIFGYRVLAISRGEKSTLPYFEENKYVKNGNYHNRSLESLISEYYHLSSANLELFNTLDDEMLLRNGTVGEREISVRAIVFITVGHEKHHLEILKTRYLV